MKFRLWILCCLLLTSVSLPVAQAVEIGAKGTEQVPGAVGVIKRAYSLGNKNSQLNFTLLEATYRADQVRLGDNVYFSAAGEKLLVLRYVIHNPEKVNQKVYWSDFKLLAVDSTDTTCEAIKDAAQANTGQKLGIVLKPGQKIEALRVVRVAAAGEVPKLIVERTSPPVVRYDLRGKVGPLPAEYADPADKSGATLLDEVPATLKTKYATGVFTASVESITYTADPVAGSNPKSGTQFALVTVSVTNMATNKESLAWSSFTPKLLFAGDEEAKYFKNLLHETRDEKLSGIKVAPGKTVTVRWWFECPAGATAQTLSFSENVSSDKGGRSFVYAIGEALPTP